MDRYAGCIRQLMLLVFLEWGFLEDFFEVLTVLLAEGLKLPHAISNISEGVSGAPVWGCVTYPAAEMIAKVFHFGSVLPFSRSLIADLLNEWPVFSAM